MKLFKFKFVHPIGKTEFQLYILQAVLIQFVFVLCSFLIFYIFELIDPNTNKLVVGASLSVLYYFILFTVFDFNKFRARYKDIYPEQELNPVYFFLSVLFPVWFWVEVGLLCFLKSEFRHRPIVFFKMRYALPVLAGVIAFQSYNPKVAYWSSSPSQYFITDAYHDMKNVVALKKEMKFGDNAFEKYTQLYSKPNSSTEVILLLALEAGVIEEESKTRFIADETNKVEIWLESKLMIAHSAKRTLSYAEKMQAEILDFSLFHWMYPTGPLEIVLMSMIDQKETNKYTPKLLSNSFKLLNSIERGVQKLKTSKRTEYMARISKLRQEFQESRTFKLSRAVASEK